MRFFIGFLGVVGLIILVFVLIFTFSGSKNDDTTVPTKTALYTYAASSKVTRLTIDGPIASETTHQAVQINVGQNQSGLNVITGYTGTVTRGQSYDNNQQSYQIFLKSLEKAGFNKGDESPALADERGACPLGRRYILEVWDGTNRVQHLWATTCGGGTFKGNLNQVITLFQRQIPDYGTLTNNTYL